MTRRCCDTAGRVSVKTLARSLTAFSPDTSSTTIRLRTGCAMAPNASVIGGAPADPMAVLYVRKISRLAATPRRVVALLPGALPPAENSRAAPEAGVRTCLGGRSAALRDQLRVARGRVSSSRDGCGGARRG